jgi:hypothetical protein
MTRRLILLACLACAPALAVAQTITVTESNDTDRIINIAECSNSPPDRLAFQWTTTTGTAFDLYVSDQAGCPAPGTTVNGVTTNAHTASVATNITQSNLNEGDTAATLLSKAQIPCTSSSSALFVCVFPAGTTTTAAATASIQLDLVSPPAPQAVSVSAGDSSLNVSWSVGTGSADAGTSGSPNTFRVYYVPADGSSGEKYATFTSATSSSGRISGLTNGTTYDITVTALTIGGNESARSSPPVPGTPVVINDFWRLYKNDGGQEQGGCATGAAGLAALAALVPLAWRRRRSRP